MEPGRPQVTIVDPSSPDRPVDVIAAGDERPSWQPPKVRLSRWQTGVLVLVVAIVANLTGAIAQVRHLEHQEELDKLAVEGLLVAVVDPSEEEVEDLLHLRNQGVEPVHVVWARLLGRDYYGIAQSIHLEPGAAKSVLVNPTTTCTPDLYTAKPDRVEVRLRTARGDTATRTVPLPATVAEVLSHASRENCGFVLPEEAVHAELVGVRRTGRSVRVEWAITNDDELPVTIERVVDPAGMGMSLQLPVRVPGETGHPGLRVVGTLRVIDCALLAGLAAGDEAFIRMAPVHVHHAYARGTGFLPLASLQAEHSEGWTPELDAVSLAVQTCPDDVFSSGD